ncbi:MAG: hypothetical protein FJZ47_08065 [Candidatus Tectomicrobia bacterium]|uniref:Uncharacterized protein n=1 Tax=Tectimicrobiota bacterium TaxID=2528274 RepID=A0A938B0G6_UNCTE|nr:hypothetical protein [Candidatus Tectomicrobia bacterium]
MQRKQQVHEWSRLRTRALVGLLKVQAPADFRTQVLARAQALSRSAALPAGRTAEPQGFWAVCRLWLRATSRAYPRTLAVTASVGGLCALAFGGGFVWHTAVQHNLRVLAPLSAVHEHEIPQPAGQAVEVSESVVATSRPPTLALLPPLSPLPSSTIMQYSTQEPEPLLWERSPLWLPPTPEVPPTALHTAMQRADTKRSTPGKSKRTRKPHGLTRHAPA